MLNFPAPSPRAGLKIRRYPPNLRLLLPCIGLLNIIRVQQYRYNSINTIIFRLDVHIFEDLLRTLGIMLCNALNHCNQFHPLALLISAEARTEYDNR